MRRLRDGSVHGSIFGRRSNAGVTPISAVNRDDCIEDRDVNYCHRAARAPGTELFAEYPRFAVRYRCMIETTGIDRDLVPVTHKIYCGALSMRGRFAVAWSGLITGPERIAVTSRETLRPKRAGRTEDKSSHYCSH